MLRRPRPAGSAASAAFVAALAVGTVVAPAAASPDRPGPPAVVTAVAAVAAPGVSSWQQGQWWVEASGLRARHAAGITGAGVDIALIDGPVSPEVPDLVGQDVRPTLSSCGEVNADQGPLSPSVALGAVSFHTTSIASVLVGSGRGNGPGGTGILGVAPGATLRTYAIFNTLDPAQNLMCDQAAMVGLVDRVVADGADIVEIPVSIETTPALLAAVNRGLAQGVIFVVGAGNGGAATQPMSPGTNPGMLVVGSEGRTGAVSPFSPTSAASTMTTAQALRASGSEIHLVAPGEEILGGGLTDGRWVSDVLQSGTSGASAVVAGELALMKQRWPGATGNQLLFSLLRNTTQPHGMPVWDPRRGFGAVDLAATLTVDPRSYPDVQPLYGGLATVHEDTPAAPRIPTQLGADGQLVLPPAAASGSTDGPTPPATGPEATGPAHVDPSAAVPASEASSSGSLAGWVSAAVLALAAVASLVIIRRRSS